jgi:SAM-dependent methyltransferase
MPEGITDRIRAESARRGPLTVAGSCLAWGGRYAAGRARLGRSQPTFAYGGRTVPYFHHRYHYTWMNERSVELALARQVVEDVPAPDLLEVGNVLAHYVRDGHTVVDLYEHAPGVVNADVVDVELPERYRLIVSISTLEHVGLDEDVTDPGKPERAIEHLRRLLAPGGRLWATIPVGYNADLDQRIRAGDLPFDRVRALRRRSHRQGWRQVELDEVWSAEYDRLLFSASGLLVCELEG